MKKKIGCKMNDAFDGRRDNDENERNALTQRS